MKGIWKLPNLLLMKFNISVAPFQISLWCQDYKQKTAQSFPIYYNNLVFFSENVSFSFCWNMQIFNFLTDRRLFVKKSFKNVHLMHIHNLHNNCKNFQMTINLEQTICWFWTMLCRFEMSDYFEIHYVAWKTIFSVFTLYCLLKLQQSLVAWILSFKNLEQTKSINIRNLPVWSKSANLGILKQLLSDKSSLLSEIRILLFWIKSVCSTFLQLSRVAEFWTGKVN